MDDVGNINFVGIMHMLTPELKEQVDAITAVCSTKRKKRIFM